MPRHEYFPMPPFPPSTPLPERKRQADGTYVPDTPLGEPYPGYSMFEQIRIEHREPKRSGWAAMPRQTKKDKFPPQAPVSTRIAKRKKKRK
jgi:hypothetical protein